MKLIFIRHGDPDYVNDSLTERGIMEADYLAEYLLNKETGEIFHSPYGRAKKTCDAYLRLSGKTSTECEWLREFDGLIPTHSEKIRKAYNYYHATDASDKRALRIPWDMLPSAYEDNPELFDVNGWKKAFNANPFLIKRYEHVTGELDKLLEKHGYINRNGYLEVISGNHDTLTFFCHFGIQCVLVSHLLNISPYVFWQHTCAPTSSITEIVTEEREKGIAQFRILQFGATPHLAIHDMDTSFSARFCEVYEDDTRH